MSSCTGEDEGLLRHFQMSGWNISVSLKLEFWWRQITATIFIFSVFHVCVFFSYICLYHPVLYVCVNAEFIRYKCTYNFLFPMFTPDCSLSVSYKSGTWAASRCKLTAQLIRLPSLWLKPESSSIRRHFNGVNHLAAWFFKFFFMCV